MPEHGWTRYRILACAATLLTTVALVAGAPATAQDSKSRAARAASSQSTSDTPTIRELRKRLDERDALILDLLQRVERLENQLAGRAPANMGPANAGPTGTVTGPSPSRSGPSTAQNLPQPPENPPQPTSPPAAQKPAPGEFSVSEEAAQHALERALVETGALVLQPGKLELVPSITYQFKQVSQPGQIVLTTTGGVLVTENVARSTQLEAGALLRVGLPWDSQAEINLPYDYKRFSVASRVLGFGLSEQTTAAMGFGDPTLSLTKQVIREGEWWPGIFASGTWDSNFGQTKKGIALGTGFNEFKAGVTAIKRQDPLVFTAGFTYQTALKNHDVAPGDQYTSAVGMLLAVSPETSLRFAQQLTFAGKTNVGGKPIPGSDQTSGIFTIGLLSILGRGLVADFSASIGETRDAPDLSVRLGFPIRLN
jgi:hypothetical protein